MANGQWWIDGKAEEVCPILGRWLERASNFLTVIEEEQAELPNGQAICSTPASALYCGV